MLGHLLKYSLTEHKPIDIIYMKGLEITQRRINVLKIDENLVKAIDINKSAIRTFKKENILSAANINHVKDKNIRVNIN